MSNDKAGATYHGRERAFLKGDWVYVTQLPEFDHRLGQIDDIRDSTVPYLVRFNDGEQYGAFDWLALTVASDKAHLAGWAPGHLQHHLISEHGVSPHLVPYDGPLSAIHEQVHAAPEETTGEHIFHKLGDDLYQDWDAREPKVDHWTPTVGQLGLSLGIIVTIILIFVFVVIFYR